MTDEELLDNFVPQGFDAERPLQEAAVMCKEEAAKVVGEIGRAKLDMARCRAEDAVNCAAKKDAADKCQSSVQNPEAVAEKLVAGMCRKFGVTTAEKVATEKFQAVVSKFYNVDPALANQLGDTVEMTASDQKKLGIGSIIFGDAEYGKKIKERADKLKTIKDKLTASGTADQEALGALEEQAKQLQEESDKYNNFFNLARLGRLFGGN